MSPKQLITQELTPVTRIERPKKFGRYTLLRKIGHGGMATLYLGRLDGPQGFERFLAVKRIHPHLAEEKQFVQMFLDEARIAAGIQHPNVVQIFELGEVNGEYFFAMEYLEGENLATMVNSMTSRGDTPPFGLMAHAIARAAEGLHAAHELRGSDGELMGLVHRDVSPHNVLVTYGGLVKVVDFGIAKASGRLAQTATGELKGKYAYMAPEQITGKNPDRRADIFALGVVLFETTTLTRLFKADNELLTLDKVLRHEMPDPRLIVPGYPKELVPIVTKALEKNPAKRYQTAADLTADLDAFAVGSREPSSAMDLAAWMGEHFAPQVEAKHQLLEAGRAAPQDVSEITLPGEEAEEPERRGLPIWLYAVLFLGLLAGGAAAAYFALRGDGLEPTGTLRISATPVEGDVYLGEDGKVGRTPIEVEGLAIGRHAVKVIAEGHQPHEAAFVIQRPGQLVTLMVPLEPNAPDTGALEILGTKGLAVSVDGQRREGTTPLKLELSQGTHKVTLSGEGLVPFEQRVTIEAGRTVALSPPPLVKLAAKRPATTPRTTPSPDQPRPEPTRHGYLNLSTAPWAVVYIGGRRIGTTPLSKAKLPAGRRSVKLVAEGSGPPKTISVTIHPNKTTRMSIRL